MKENIPSATGEDGAVKQDIDTYVLILDHNGDKPR
tara:strand:- start:17807 stop:17911 length:105 start_codon:yes stop_codon:yes gene_type:complete